MRTRSTIRIALASLATLCFASVAFAPAALAHEEPEPSISEPGPASPKLETLLSTVLSGVENTEVIVSRVTLPPHTTLPKHWHPGEEFIYVLEGSATMWQEGKPDMTGNAGDVFVVPLKQVHTAITGDVGATALVFRVHEKGQPERVLVE